MEKVVVLYAVLRVKVTVQQLVSLPRRYQVFGRKVPPVGYYIPASTGGYRRFTIMPTVFFGVLRYTLHDLCAFVCPAVFFALCVTMWSL